MGHMDTYMGHGPLHVFRLILHGALPKYYWGQLSLIMLIRRSTGCFKWYFWIFEHLAKCANGQCHWCSDASQSGLCIHNTLTSWHLFDNLTSYWLLAKLKPPQPVTGRGVSLALSHRRTFLRVATLQLIPNSLCFPCAVAIFPVFFCRQKIKYFNL